MLNFPAVHGENGWGVTCSPLQICALKGSTVKINCSYEYPLQINGKNTEVRETFWFRTKTNYMYVDLKTDPDFSNRVQYHCVNHICHLSITDLRERDSAEYKFRFTTNSGKYTGSPGVALSVTGDSCTECLFQHIPLIIINLFMFSSFKMNLFVLDPQLQVIGRSAGNQYSWTELSCHSDCQLPDSVSYIWFKNRRQLQEHKKHLILQKVAYTDGFKCALEEYNKFLSLVACRFTFSLMWE